MSASDISQLLDVEGRTLNLFISHELNLDSSFQETSMRLCSNRKMIMENLLDMASLDAGIA